jgi:transcriptional regulator with XRE-family HTH domain
MSVATLKLKRLPVPSAKTDFYSAIADFSNQSDTYGGRRLASGPTIDDPRQLKTRVYRRAEQLGLSMTQVLVRSGVSKSQLYDVMEGKKQPTVGWLRKLAGGLEWQVSDLITGPVSKLPPPPRIRADRKVPLLRLRATAGAFLEAERAAPPGYLLVPPPRPVTEDMFAATVVGRSMEKLILNGAVCLFRLIGSRSPEGKVVLLLLHNGARDPETGGRYTVKRFRVLQRHGRRIAKVRLDPANRDIAPIVLEKDPERELKVIAEFLKVLVPPPE